MVPRPWRGAALARNSRPAIFASTRAWSLFKQALPETFQRMLGLLARRADEQSSNEAMDKTWRAVISGSRLFNTVFGLPRRGV
jgi:hypothetical protein